MKLLVVLLSAAAAIAHPLDPLTKEEIKLAVDILRADRHLTPESRVPLLSLAEPPKLDMLADRPVARRAKAVVYERQSRTTFEAMVDLASRRTIAWKEVKDVQPPLLLEDFALAEQIVKSDSAWTAAVRKRGVTDLKRVQVDAWGYQGEGAEPHRTVRAVSWYRGNEVSAYFHPIEGVVAWVDLDDRRIERLVDTGVMPLAKPPVLDNPDYKSDLKALTISQPAGPSFRVTGHEVAWDRWRFRYSFDPREGLVLYSVGWQEGNRIRSILYRASLADMVVPYGDPSPAWYFRNAFDISEYSFTGRSLFPLTAGADVPDNASFLNATFADENGRAYEIERAAALYERDGGVLWRYADIERGHPVTRRARDLVLSTFMSAPPYEYAFNWIFHEDGRLEMVVSLTGIMQTKAVAAGANEEHGHHVAPDLEAVHHQHFFNFRLDFDIDGVANRVSEMDTGAGIMTMETPLARELEAKRNVSQADNRMWKIFNPATKAGYFLIPGDNAFPYAAQDSWLRRRAGFLDAHFWATPFEEAEQYPAGDYVYQSKGGEGLTKWTQKNRTLTDRDIVAWYTLGVTHIPRPEEWPVMPVHEAGFQLAPAGFFRSNPAMNSRDITR